MSEITKVKKEIVPVISESQTSVENLLSQAVKQGASVETMEKLLAMRRELKAEFAKEAFDKAMADFQKECPVIKKKKAGGKTNSGQVGYMYAPLESIVEQVKGLLHDHGFSYSIQTKTGDKKVTAICTAKHVNGHSESSDMEIPLGGKTGIMSDSQVTAAAITFAKRYAFCNAFGILTGDADTNTQESASGEPNGAVESAIKKLRAQKTLDGLHTAWKGLTQKQRDDDEVLAVKDELKRKL